VSLSCSALQRGLLVLQVADLRGDGSPAGQRLAGQILATRRERLLRLALQLGGRLLQRGELKLDTPAAGCDVRQPAAYLLQQFQLPLVGVVQHLPGVLGAAVAGATRDHGVLGTFAPREPDRSEVDNGREGVVMLFTGVDSLDAGIGKATAWLADAGAGRRCAFRRRAGY